MVNVERVRRLRVALDQGSAHDQNVHDRKKSGFLSLCLTIVASALALFVVAGTIWSFAAGKAHPGSGLIGTKAQTERSLFSGGKKNPSKDEVLAGNSGAKAGIFADIGTLRAGTADKKPVTVIISPFFPYPPDDIAFREELVSKTRAMRWCWRGWRRRGWAAFRRANRSSRPWSAPMYHFSREEYEETLRFWAEKHPGILVLETRGVTREKMPILLLRISDKSVPDVDEDTATIAVGAARNAIMRGADPKKIGAIYVGSESHPYAVKPSSAVDAVHVCP